MIQEAIENLIDGRTVFAIAHRLSTLRNADRLVVIDDGTIAQMGTHDELLGKEGGIYKKLEDMQLEVNKLQENFIAAEEGISLGDYTLGMKTSAGDSELSLTLPRGCGIAVVAMAVAIAFLLLLGFVHEWFQARMLVERGIPTKARVVRNCSSGDSRPRAGYVYKVGGTEYSGCSDDGDPDYRDQRPITIYYLPETPGVSAIYPTWHRNYIGVSILFLIAGTGLFATLLYCAIKGKPK